MHPYDHLDHLATPQDGIPHCSTHAAYIAAHTRQMTGLRAALPSLGYRLPWAAPLGAAVWITGGKFVVVCACGDAPMASLEWDEARCFACGAVYTRLAWPPDLAAVTQALLARPVAATRAWLLGETASDLHRQNAEHGVEGGT